MDNIYTIYDKVAEECGPLFQAKSDAVACRSTRSLLENVTDVNDYKLLRIGYFDKEKGQITMEPIPLEIDIYELKIEVVE